MLTQLRFLSKMAGIVAVFGLMALMSGTRAQAQSMSITDFSYTGSPGGYYDVTDTVHVGLEIDGNPYSGGYGYSILAYTYYYSGANGSGTLLQTTTTTLYSHSAPIGPGNTYVSDYVNLNTPDILRASEPAGTQSFRYVYILQAGGGGYNWSRQLTTGGPTNLVHG
jgi:hypothetical protein